MNPYRENDAPPMTNTNSNVNAVCNLIAVLAGMALCGFLAYTCNAPAIERAKCSEVAR